MKIYLLIATCILSLSVAAAPKKAAKLPPAPSQEELDLKAREEMVTWAKTLIADRLKDPESARFRDVFTSPRILAVCGEVNAKNSMGGYVGFRRFIAAKDKAGIEEDGRYFVEANWDSRCKLDVPD